MPIKIFSDRNFFGRNKELEALCGIAFNVKDGDVTSIFLSGRSGIGKTELLRQLFNHLFWQQDNAVPFFYVINEAFTSIADFSRDYLYKFILQSLAFHKKEPSIINTCTYLFEDLIELARKSGLQWAVDIMDDYLVTGTRKDPLNQLLFAVSAPYRSYQCTGAPVIIMIDDFHKTRNFYKFKAEDNTNFWLLFDDSIKNCYTPYILTGLQPVLHKMFFYESSLGEHLELIELAGLDRNSSTKLFTSLLDTYNLRVDIELSDFIDLFQGNPFYIKSFVQSAKRTGGVISEEEFWTIYSEEVTKGKIYKYWTSHITRYIPVGLREASLRLLYHLHNESNDISLANLPGFLAVSKEELDSIVTFLQTAGVIEKSFSLLRLVDDTILIDVIRGLYHLEILKEPLNKIKYVITDSKHQPVKRVETPSFEITIPSTRNSELVALKGLEQIANNLNIPPDTTGQVQVALAELLNGVVARSGSTNEGYHLRFSLKGSIFSVELFTSQKEIVLTDDEKNKAFKLIRPYIDDIKVERIMNGTRITLLKKLGEDPVHIT